MSHRKRLYLGILALIGVMSAGCGTEQPISSPDNFHWAREAGHPPAGCHMSKTLFSAKRSKVYASSSPGYVFRTFVSRANRLIPYRQGNSHFGLVRVVGSHDVSASIIGLTVEKGVMRRNPGTGTEIYVAWFYDPALPPGDPYRYQTVRVVVSLALMRDGMPKGIVRADANHDISFVPHWIRSPDAPNCAWGGAGSQP